MVEGHMVWGQTIREQAVLGAESPGTRASLHDSVTNKHQISPASILLILTADLKKNNIYKN